MKGRVCVAVGQCFPPSAWAAPMQHPYLRWQLCDCLDAGSGAVVLPVASVRPVHALCRPLAPLARSVCHSATVFANSLMHCGTTVDAFLRENLEWLKKATNWAKFSATAGAPLAHLMRLARLSLPQPAPGLTSRFCCWAQLCRPSFAPARPLLSGRAPRGGAAPQLFPSPAGFELVPFCACRPGSDPPRQRGQEPHSDVCVPALRPGRHHPQPLLRCAPSLAGQSPSAISLYTTAFFLRGELLLTLLLRLSPL